eukprot:SAG31_NODE_47_length_30979_cov_41.708841_27_plen_92_part_00
MEELWKAVNLGLLLIFTFIKCKIRSSYLKFSMRVARVALRIRAQAETGLMIGQCFSEKLLRFWRFEQALNGSITYATLVQGCNCVNFRRID